MHALRNERGIVVDWIVKLIIGLAIGGVLLYDIGSCVVNYVTLDGTANDIANAAATESSQADQITQRSVELDAEELADQSGVRLVSAELDREGVVHIELRRTADTLLFGRFGFSKGWTKAVATGRARTQ